GPRPASRCPTRKVRRPVRWPHRPATPGSAPAPVGETPSDGSEWHRATPETGWQNTVVPEREADRQPAAADKNPPPVARGRTGAPRAHRSTAAALPAPDAIHGGSPFPDG